jgi:hypothetical protein
MTAIQVWEKDDTIPLGCSDFKVNYLIKLRPDDDSDLYESDTGLTLETIPAICDFSDFKGEREL